jgi:hypothetical protein
MIHFCCFPEHTVIRRISQYRNINFQENGLLTLFCVFFLFRLHVTQFLFIIFSFMSVLVVHSEDQCKQVSLPAMLHLLWLWYWLTQPLLCLIPRSWKLLLTLSRCIKPLLEFENRIQQLLLQISGSTIWLSRLPFPAVTEVRLSHYFVTVLFCSPFSTSIKSCQCCLVGYYSKQSIKILESCPLKSTTNLKYCTMFGVLDRFWPSVVPCWSTWDAVQTVNWYYYSLTLTIIYYAVSHLHSLQSYTPIFHSWRLYIHFGI